MNRLRRAKSDFAIIPNKAMRDRRLSPEARGLLAYLMTHSDSYEFSYEAVQEEMRCGKDKMQRMVRELTEAGYLRRTPRQIEGKMCGQIWEIIDEPECGISRVPENPTVEKPGTLLEDQDSKKIKRKKEYIPYNSLNGSTASLQTQPSHQARPFRQFAKKKEEENPFRAQREAYERRYGKITIPQKEDAG